MRYEENTDAYLLMNWRSGIVIDDRGSKQRIRGSRESTEESSIESVRSRSRADKLNLTWFDLEEEEKGASDYGLSYPDYPRLPK